MICGGVPILSTLKKSSIVPDKDIRYEYILRCVSSMETSLMKDLLQTRTVFLA